LKNSLFSISIKGNKMTEFMSLTQEEKAELITDMVVEIAKETSLPIQHCIQLVAEYKSLPVTRIEHYIKKHDPALFYHVAFYHGEQKVFKQQVDREVKRILSEKLGKIIEDYPIENVLEHTKKALQEFYEVEK
jgi:hypothetical protein